MQPCLHGHDTGAGRLGHLDLAPAFLREREQRAILRRQLLERVTERIEFLAVHGAGRFRHVLVLGPKCGKDPTQLLAPQVVDAGVASQPKQPGLELGHILQPAQRPDHLDEDLLRQILHDIAATCDRVDKPRNPPLVTDNKPLLGGFFAPLGPSNKVGERGCCRLIRGGAFLCFA